jgi:hypothetical protein
VGPWRTPHRAARPFAPRRPRPPPTGRKALPAHLPVEEHALRPGACAHCGSTALDAADEVIEEKLHVVKEHQRRRVVKRTTCRCRTCGGRTTPRSLPAPYPRSKVTGDWLAWLVATKFSMLTPLDRTRRDLKERGANSLRRSPPSPGPRRPRAWSASALSRARSPAGWRGTSRTTPRAGPGFGSRPRRRRPGPDRVGHLACSSEPSDGDRDPLVRHRGPRILHLRRTLHPSPPQGVGLQQQEGRAHAIIDWVLRNLRPTGAKVALAGDSARASAILQPVVRGHAAMQDLGQPAAPLRRGP